MSGRKVKLVTVIGARPQFIKAAAVSRALAATRAIQEILVHSGQHYDHGMSQIFFEELGIPEPAIHLGVGSGSHAVQTGRIMIELEKHCDELKPDMVMVYGDTNTTLAAALAAAKLHIPVAHVEAGLRSFNRTMPEEINRLLTDQVSDLLFAPTAVAVDNLRREGVDGAKVHRVGDVMFDVALLFKERAIERSDVLARLRLRNGPYVLATIHRAGNTDDRGKLEGIVAGLERVARTIPVVWPIHPRTRQSLHGAGIRCEGIPGLLLMEPVGYLDMVALEAAAKAIVTDSGGVQKEAFFHRVPCVTVRPDTEWTELVSAGVNRLCAAEPGAIFEAVQQMMACAGDWNAPDYGDGHAAARIASVIAGCGS